MEKISLQSPQQKHRDGCWSLGFILEWYWRMNQTHLTAGSGLALELDKSTGYRQNNLELMRRLKESDAATRPQVPLCAARSVVLIGYNPKHCGKSNGVTRRPGRMD